MAECRERVMVAMCCGDPPVLAEDRSHCEGFRLLSQLSVDVRVSRDVKRKQISRDRGSLGAPVGNVWRCDAVAKRLLQFCGVQLAVDTSSCPHCTATSRHADVQPTGTEAAFGEGRPGRRRAPRRYF